MKGPYLINSLVGVLLRFRKKKIPFVADVEAMFLQIRVLPPDQDAMRFFWWPQGNLEAEPFVFRMTIHLFEAKSSLSCASFCLRATAKEFGKHFDSQISRLVLETYFSYQPIPFHSSLCLCHPIP